MKGFKQCDKGHFYKEELEYCNYCPQPGSAEAAPNNPAAKTQLFGTQTTAAAGSPAGNDATQVFGTGRPGDQTQIAGAGINTGASAPAAGRDLSKTFIQGIDAGTGSGAAATPRDNRRITGWIISYTLDPQGMDFRIYEGNNTIGRDPANSITITKDSGVSGRHVIILSKKGQFFLKDEMTVNGTFLNNEEIEIGKPYELKDGDEIRLGQSTTFKFKSAL